MRRHHLCLAAMAAVTASALLVWRSSSGAPQPAEHAEPGERQPANRLPLQQIVLFNSGVGYFQREGSVDGDARVDLQFPAAEVNDLLKSLVLQDLGHGKVTTVSYDGQEPVERILKTFALDLTGNPSFGQMLNQARGEKIEVTLQNAGSGANTLTGTIVGMESQMEPGPREVHHLNLLCTEGMRCVPLNTVQRVRFLNAVLDSELRRALDVLAGAHDSQKKNVSVQFHGEGKRTVKVGYVVEAPMWKSSYRLVFDKAGKATLQGWAIIENTSEEDWKDVRMALVSSRPISFQMDLYQPLFVPRPVVEPERFASLRPPEYQGPLTNNGGNLGNIGPGIPMGVAGIGGIGGLGGQGFSQPGQGGAQIGFQGGAQLGFQGGINRYQMGNNLGQGVGVNRLTYEELQKRRQEREKARAEAKKVGNAIADFDPTQSINSAAVGEMVGDQARYVIDHKISLARQRSALLPLVNQEITGQRVSIFNDKVNSKFPLRGFRFKNATGQNLMQGPVSVYDGGSYAGDARLPDLQANEERLLSFAIDQAVEIKTESKSDAEMLMNVRISKGMVELTHRQRTTMKYLIKNRSNQERTLLVEHPVNADWKLVGEEKPAERSRDFYRFEWKIPAGKAMVREVVQERTSQQKYAAITLYERSVEWLVHSAVLTAKQREALNKALEYKRVLSVTQHDLARLRVQLTDVTQEQTRIRSSLDKVPDKSALQKRYLEKLDKLETDIEGLQTKIKETQEKEKAQQKELDQYLENLTVE